jgi:hypothetical protein
MIAVEEPKARQRMGKLDNLKKIMKARNISTNQELSNITGIPVSFVDDLVRGTRGASYSTAKQIAGRLGLKNGIEDLTGRPVGVVRNEDLPPQDGDQDGEDLDLYIENIPSREVVVLRDFSGNAQILEKVEAEVPEEDQGNSYFSADNFVLRVEEGLAGMSKQIGALQSQQTEMKATLDLIKKFIDDNPPRRRLFG